MSTATRITQDNQEIQCNPLLWLAYRLFCRDLETACDQAVIRRFGAKDTAQYAAALLHLGHSGKLPQAVPLAFGEEISEFYTPLVPKGHDFLQTIGSLAQARQDGTATCEAKGDGTD